MKRLNEEQQGRVKKCIDGGGHYIVQTGKCTLRCYSCPYVGYGNLNGIYGNYRAKINKK